MYWNAIAQVGSYQSNNEKNMFKDNIHPTANGHKMVTLGNDRYVAK